MIPDTDINSEFRQKLRIKEDEQLALLHDHDFTPLTRFFNTYDEGVELLKSKNHELYIFKDTQLVFWTNNDVDPHELQHFKKKNETPFYFKNRMGFYLATCKVKNNISCFAVFKFYNHYLINNEFFSNGISKHLNFNKADFAGAMPTFDNDSTQYRSIEQLPPIDETIYNGNQKSRYAQWLYILGFVLFVIFSGMLSFRDRRFDFKKFVIVSTIFVFILLCLLFFNVIMKQRSGYALFQPEVAAYNQFIPSLGHSIIFSFCIICILIIIYQLITNKNQSYFGHVWHYIPVSLAIWFSFYILFLNVFPTFIMNSQINFDFTDLANVSFLTLVAMFAVFQFFLIMVIYFRILSHTFNHQFKRKQFIIYHFVIGVPVFLILYLHDHTNGFLLLCFFTLSIITCYLLLFPVALKVKHVLFASAIFSAYLAVQFDQLNSEKEHEQRKIFANKFISQEDFENELNLSKIENELVLENVFSEFFDYQKNDFPELELNYKYTYFSDYIKNYDIDFLRYDSLGKEITANNFSFNAINSIYNSSTHRSISNYFLQIKDVNYLGGYLSKYEICPAKKTLGYVFVILIPKIKSELYNLDYFFNKKANSVTSSVQYSFAVYQNKELIKSIGSFPFKLKDNTKFLTMEDASFFEQQDFSHLLKKIDQQTFLIVSQKATNWQKKTGGLTFVFLFFIGVLCVGYLLLYCLTFVMRLFSASRSFNKIYVAFLSHLRIVKANRLYLETKIRISFLMMAVIICSLVSYFTVQNVNSSFNEKQNEELDKKMSQIVNEIEIGFQRKTEHSVSTLIKHLSNTYEVDINLYQPDGSLIQAGNDKIYKEGWFAPLMNCTAYYELAKNKQYSFKQTERIGKLSYLSSYNALFDENRKLIGYVHLPYFSKSLDLKKEFSKYLGGLLNISTLLLLISLAVATYVGKTLVQPLKIMIDRLSHIRVGLQNTPIQWSGNDEIGQLVEQYNLMLEKLAISTERLAQSEREGAWKEMAKQVAHEIKNPLTPMKLHLQHLQFAIERNDDNLPDKIKKITSILIEQIDQLSRMAEEFSSFAQMPLAILEVSNVTEILTSTVQLFKVQSGIEIHFEPVDAVAPAYIDKGQVQRVFTNILKNAQQAAKDDTPCIIKVEMKILDDFIHISFEDNGKGMDDDLKEKIFIPNFSTKTSGMGLGLAICKKIIENVNGSITFFSKVNIGTTFYVTLPLYSGK